MTDNLLNNPSELKYLWKIRGTKNYDLKSFFSNGTVIQYLMLEDIRDNRKLIGKLVKYPKEGEAYHWPRLQHENLAPLLDIVSINEEISVFISPVIGCNLRSVIHDREFMLDPECYNRKKAYAEDILWALDYLHDKALCMMNLTDLGICVCGVFDVAMICDFSCICLIERVDKHKVDLPILYQAPELNDEYFDPVAAETWACGVLFLQTFTAHCLPATAISDKVRQVIEAVDEMNCDIIKEANPGAQIDISVINDLREFLNLFLVENPKCRVDIRSAAVHHFFMNSRKSMVKNCNSFRFSQSNKTSEHPWTIGKSKSIYSRNKHPKNSSAFKDIYLKEVENFKNNWKKPAGTKALHPKFINLDFVPDGDTISNYPEDNQSNITDITNDNSNWNIEKSILEKVHPSKMEHDSNKPITNNNQKFSQHSESIENERNVYDAEKDNKGNWNIKMSILEYVHSSRMVQNSNKSVAGNNGKLLQHFENVEYEREVNNIGNNKRDWSIEKTILDHAYPSERMEYSSKPVTGIDDKLSQHVESAENDHEINNVSNNNKRDWKKEKSILDNAHSSETEQNLSNLVIVNTEKVFQNSESVEKERRNNVENNKRDCKIENSILKNVHLAETEQDSSKPMLSNNEQFFQHSENVANKGNKGYIAKSNEMDYNIEQSVLESVHLSEIEQDPCKSVMGIQNGRNRNDAENDNKNDCNIEQSLLRSVHSSETEQNSSESCAVISTDEKFCQHRESIENICERNELTNDSKSDCNTEKPVLKPAHPSEAQRNLSKLVIGIKNELNRNDVGNGNKSDSNTGQFRLEPVHPSEGKQDSSKSKIYNNEKFFQHLESKVNGRQRNNVANGSNNGCNTEKSVLESAHPSEADRNSDKPTMNIDNGLNGVANDNKSNTEKSVIEPFTSSEVHQDLSTDNTEKFLGKQHLRNTGIRCNKNNVSNDNKSYWNTGKSICVKPSETKQYPSKSMISNNEKFLQYSEGIKIRHNGNDVAKNKNGWNTDESTLKPKYPFETEQESRISKTGNKEYLFQYSKIAESEGNIDYVPNDKSHCDIESQQRISKDYIKLHNPQTYEDESFSIVDDLRRTDNIDGTQKPSKSCSFEGEVSKYSQSLEKQHGASASSENQIQRNYELRNKYLIHELTEQQLENKKDTTMEEDNFKIRKKKSFLKFAFSRNKKSKSVAKEMSEINRRDRAKDAECILSEKNLSGGNERVFYTQNSVYIENNSVDDTTAFGGKRKKNRINWMRYLCPGSGRKANR